jgi:uncharacterized protein YndB with AHSA1/START domain
MTELAQNLRVPAVRFERTLAGPIEHVWEHLTRCGNLPGWYGDSGIIEPRDGGMVNFAGGHIRGVVTQWRPCWRLAHTWNVFEAGETHSAYPESYLTFDLAQAGEAISLTLTHLPVVERFEKQNAMGWHSFLDMLEAALRGEAVEDRRVYMQKNARLYGVDLDRLER